MGAFGESRCRAGKADIHVTGLHFYARPITSGERPNNPLPTGRAESWMARAACRDHDPELWHPVQSGHAPARAAKQICHTCPVQLQCLDYATSHTDLTGIWGGYTERERRERRNRA